MTDIDIFRHEKAEAEKTRKLLATRGILGVNVMGSPGSGKTTFLESLITSLGKEKCAVIEGDLSSSVDTERLQEQGIDAVQINTGSGCHLTPDAVARALKRVRLEGKEWLFIENVGNLVCPAHKDLGEGLRMVVSSSPEGSDKPRKYPLIFHFADAVILSKGDLALASGFDAVQFKKNALAANPKLQFFSFTQGEPLEKKLLDFFRK